MHPGRLAHSGYCVSRRCRLCHRLQCCLVQMKVVIEIAAVNGEFRSLLQMLSVNLSVSFGFVVSNQAVAEFVVGGSCAGQSGQIQLVGVAAAIYDAVVEVGLSGELVASPSA